MYCNIHQNLVQDTGEPRCTLMGEPFDFCARGGWFWKKNSHTFSGPKKSCYMEKKFHHTHIPRWKFLCVHKMVLKKYRLYQITHPPTHPSFKIIVQPLSISQWPLLGLKSGLLQYFYHGTNPLAPVVRRLGNAIHQKNCYPVDKC